ncbi:MAG: hypothetical protein ACRC8A_16965 [Microcoleaceae cyanobacterium]
MSFAGTPILRTATLLSFNQLTNEYLEDEILTRSFRLEIFNLILISHIRSLPVSAPPKIRDFDSSYDRWMALEEHFQDKVHMKARVAIGNYPLMEARIFNYKSPWKNNLTEDFNQTGKRLQIGKNQSVELMLHQDYYQGVEGDILDLHCNYVLYRDTESEGLSRSVSSKSMEVSEFKTTVLNNTSVYSIDLKNDGEEIIFIDFSSDPSSDGISLKSGESFCFNEEGILLREINLKTYCLPKKTSRLGIIYKY